MAVRASRSFSKSSNGSGTVVAAAAHRALSRPSSSASAWDAHSSTPRPRREPAATGSNCHGIVTWQWLHPRGTWQDFDAGPSKQLERAHAAGAHRCSFSTTFGKVDVDLRKMTHRLLGNPGCERKVRRAPVREQSPANVGGAGSTAIPIPVASSSTTAERRSLRSVGTSVVSRRAEPALGHVNTSRATAAGPFVETADDESLAMALAMEEEDRFHRQWERTSPGTPMDGDAALAMILAHDMEDTDAILAAVVAAETMEGIHHSFTDARAPQHPDAVDVDRMGYEELVALGERIGYAERSNKPTEAMLRRLPTRSIRAGENGHDDAECSVCCDVYAPRDELRTLPCLHSFHSKCIDEWLTSDMPGARSCPVCHTRVDFE